jgi:hypothetical protein
MEKLDWHDVDEIPEPEPCEDCGYDFCLCNEPECSSCGFIKCACDELNDAHDDEQMMMDDGR